MNVDHLLVRPSRSVRGKRRPSQTDLRRHVSDIYYAMFHALCLECSNALIGSTRRNSSAWVRAYRAVNHGSAKEALKTRSVQQIDPAVAAYATLFITLQDERHKADYDPRPFPHNNLQVRPFTEQVRLAVSGLRGLSADNKRMLAVSVLFKERP